MNIKNNNIVDISKSLKQYNPDDFPFKISNHFLNRFNLSDGSDPLLKQFLPDNREEDIVDGFSDDPLAEKKALNIKGLITKYKNRALVYLTPSCRANCRYCFRRHFKEVSEELTKSECDNIVRYFDSSGYPNELILSGGDPLSASDSILKYFIDKLRNSGKIKRLRIHTRFPVVDPLTFRVDVLDYFIGFEKIMVVQVNHPLEIDQAVKTLFLKIKNLGWTIFNQSVLLKDVNDDENVLFELSEKLFSAGVIPYYLHQLDRVQGAAHFEVTEDKAKKIMKSFSSLAPGYLVPKYVREEPGDSSKRIIDY